MLKVRDIVIANRQPRRLELQPNLVMNDEGKPEYKEYASTLEGIIQSYCERFPKNEIDATADQWKKDWPAQKYL